MIDKIRVKLDEGARIDAPAHKGDAGYDIYSRELKVIYSRSGEVFHTGVHMEIPQGYVGILKSKSGLNVKYDITGEGVIDSGYTGEICVKLYNNSLSERIFKPGDKLIQILVVPVITPALEFVDDIEGGSRGDNGFGSTGY
jgi:dUTP pyrophosphatase